MEFLVHSWLTQRADTSVKSNHAKMEAILAHLYDSLENEHYEDALTIIQTHELAILAQRLSTSPLQETRFWFLTAQHYACMEKLKSSNEAYTLCNQTCPRQDDLALLEIHHNWGHVAFRDAHYLQALKSFSRAISITEQPNLRKQPYMMYSDREGLLSNMYLHRAFVAQKLGQLDLSTHDLEVVSQYVVSWSNQATSPLLTLSTSRIIESLSSLQSAITTKSEGAQQTWNDLLGALRPSHQPRLGHI